jgi:thiamine biosynthesis lipoprotein ApbE
MTTQCRLVQIFLLMTGLVMQAHRLTAHEAAGRWEFHHENVLGTSLDLRVAASSAEAAEAAESRVLAEIDRLNQIFSTYQSDSHFSRWQRSFEQPVALPAELLEVLAASQRWREQTSGAFNSGVEILSRLWQQAARQSTTPHQAELGASVQQAAYTHWRIDAANGLATRLSQVPLNLNAIAKGYIIDCACQAALNTAEVSGVVVNIGGDLAVRGSLRQQIDIANPARSAENAPALARVLLTDRALATSGNYDRNFLIAGQRRSHIIDPRTGQPADHIASASVIAPSAMDADALATAFCVLKPSESLRLAGSLPHVECLIVDRHGLHYHTAGWPQHVDTTLASKPPAGAFTQSGNAPAAIRDDVVENGFELKIELQINRPEAARYERPYVAVWIEDDKNFPVRTLALWVKTAGSGPTWIPDLKRWFRGDLKRLLTDKTDLVVTRSSVTRPPGKHELVWDGTDNQKQPLPQGNYTVLIEAAREHGTYQIIRIPVTLGDKPLEMAVDGNLEIKSARLEYRPAKLAR